MFDEIAQSNRIQTGQAMPQKIDVLAQKEAQETQKASKQEKEKKNEQNLKMSQEVLDGLKHDFEMMYNVGFVSRMIALRVGRKFLNNGYSL